MKEFTETFLMALGAFSAMAIVFGIMMIIKFIIDLIVYIFKDLFGDDV
jgi:hypothetical protein